MPMSRLSGAVALVLVLAAAGCGRGKDEPVDPCPRVDASSRELVGAVVRQPVGTGLLEILPAEGKARRSGGLLRLRIGDYTFRARGEAEGGGLEGRRGARAEPVPGVSGAGYLEAYSVSYAKGGQDFAGRVAVGRPTPGSRLPTSGQAHYRGPASLTVQDRRGGAPAGEVALAGTADVVVSFGSRAATVSFANLAPVAAGDGAPFASLEWTGIGMCNVRLGSTGQGGFRMAGPGGEVVNLAGPGAGSPGGSAVLDASFYGFDAATAQPAGVGGVLLIQGDTGLVSGVFAAGATN
jgi:hypothetical protein